MDAKILEQQIERYFDAALSADEERELVRWLTASEVPEHLEHDKQVILALHETAASDHTEAMERLSCKIDVWEAEEHRPIRRALTVRLWKAASVAACAVLVVGLSLQLLRPSTPRDTFDNPEDAYTATREALLALSSALNKGTDYVSMAMETGGKVERSVNHQLEILKGLNNN